MALCKICGENVQNAVVHGWQEHREEMLARNRQVSPLGKATQQRIYEASAKAKRAAKKGARKAARALGEEEETGGGGNGSQPAAATPATPATPAAKRRTATGLMDSVAIAIVPKTLTISSSLFSVCKQACEREWNWPEMEPGDWLDTYLYWTMKQRGIVIGAYQVLQKEDGNGG